jgi:predicted enzyme related to lactoylglutathione lyase
MKKFAFVLGASALATAGAAMAQPAGAPRVADMSGAPVAAPVKGSKVLMLRTFVSDLDRSTKFYQAVFGMTAVQMPGFGGPAPARPGAAAPARPAAPAGAAPGRGPGGGGGGGIRILNFPGGSPGMIMIRGSGDPAMMRGSYVIQVPDLAKALAAAEANGGKVQTTRFTAGGQESRHVFDPDGNDLEIMQSGPAPK